MSRFECWITNIYTLLIWPCFLVFDDEDENKLSYTEIHLQYKKLVSTVLGPDVLSSTSSCIASSTLLIDFILLTHQTGLM